MTTARGLGETTIYQWLLPQVTTLHTHHITHNGITYRVDNIPTRVAGETLYAIFDHNNVEIFRFAFTFGVRRKPTPTPPTPLLEQVPDEPLEAPITPPVEWIEGQWGPEKLADGLGYARTPTKGDIVWSDADDSEWTVVTCLTHSNPNRVTIQNENGDKFSFTKKWTSPVKFRRSKIAESKKILETILGAQEIDDSNLKQDNWIVGDKGGKRW